MPPFRAFSTVTTGGVTALEIGGIYSGAAIGASACGTAEAATTGIFIGHGAALGTLSATTWLSGGLAAWVTGIAIGCAASCGMDACSY